MDNTADEQIKKSLFNKYASCKFFKVSEAGEVMSCKDIDVQYVSIDKNGNVYVDWNDGSKYEQRLESAEVDVVWHAWHNYVEGVFTSEEEALATAKAWYIAMKLKRIAELEEELAKLKAECKDCSRGEQKQ